MKVNILGVPIHNVSLDEAVEEIIEMVDKYRNEPTPKYIATANVDFLVNTLSWFPGKIKCRELYQALISAKLVTADGMPIVWLSALLGNRLKERVTGADLIPRLAVAASKKNISMFFLGGRKGIGQRAAKRLANQNPGLKIVGSLSPMVDLEETDRKTIDQINRSEADILLIALGSPKQEFWFQRNKHLIKVPVSIGVGGTFDFIAGKISRSPEWMQENGLEWLFRLFQEPKRLCKRYCVDFFKFGFLAGLTVLKTFINSVLLIFDPTIIDNKKKRYNTSMRNKI